VPSAGHERKADLTPATTSPAGVEPLNEVPPNDQPPQPRLAPISPASRETFIAVLALVSIVLHLALRYLFTVPLHASRAPLYVTLIIGGVPLLITLLRKLLAREFGSDLLAGISIVTSVLLGEYLVGCIVVLMLSGGSALERFASRRASAVLDALAKRMPQTAHRKLDDTISDVVIGEIRVGDCLVVFPYEICPVDGSVLEGQGKMNEAYLTGEPFEISKTPGSQVLSGSVNGESALTVRADKLPINSRYAGIMKVMRETEQRRPRLRRLGDTLGAWYTPVALGLAILAWALTGHTHRFLAVLVVATPCPLLIAIPVAVIGAISLSARRGIIIKNPAVLEQVEQCRTWIFDKTGTLTYGKPKLDEVICAPGFDRSTVLRLAACLERYSKHPLASAVLDAAQADHLYLESASEISEHPGEGLRGTVANRKIWITGRARVEMQGVALPPPVAGLECVVLLDGAYAATLRFHDAPRKESRHFVGHLRPRHAVNRVMLVSGDRDLEVRYLAGLVGITEVHSAKSPEEKVAIVRSEAARQKTLFVGDGINDAPAMQAATVGVAFGVSSDVTAEAADAVVMEGHLGKVDELIHIGTRMRAIALQSAVGGMLLSIIGMFAAAFGYLPPIGGAVAQEAIDLLAVLNAVRAALPFKDLTDF
jgi:heavy metal translocating P-type ATPase